MVLNEKGISGKDSHFALRQAVQKEEEEKRMYPTPQARDSKGSSGRRTSYKGLDRCIYQQQ